MDRRSGAGGGRVQYQVLFFCTDLHIMRLSHGGMILALGNWERRVRIERSDQYNK